PPAALKPLPRAVGLGRIRVATYQSVSGAGAQAMERLRAQTPEENDLRMDWSFDGVEFDEEEKLREETRKILELPALSVSATCVRVPVLVGHAEAVWIETKAPLSAEQATSILGGAPGLRLEQFPTPGGAAGGTTAAAARVRQIPPANPAPCRATGDEQTAALVARIPGTVAVLGDAVYERGTAQEFRDCYSWGRFRGRTRAALGNHEYGSGNAAAAIAYFHLPRSGYYSYDLGDWHVVVLNSNCGPAGGCGRGSPQQRWLAAGLGAQPRGRTLAPARP